MNCAVCQKPAQNACSACLQVYYCTPQHQKEDWKFHKTCCSPFIIKEADVNRKELGVQFFATRNLKAGTILLDEKPAFHAPTFSKFEKEFNDDSLMFCLTCGLNMTIEKENRCTTCRWPICSPQCETMPIHAVECKIFSKSKVVFPPQNLTPTEVSLCLLMIRGMSLKKTNKSLFDEVMKLQDEHAIPNFLTQTIYHHACNKLKLLIGELSWPEEEYQKILRIVTINGFSVDYQEINSDKTMFRNRAATYLYVKASRANHSCIPNCTRNIGQKPNFLMRIRTSVPVEKGQPLTLCYGEAGESYLGTLERQRKNMSGGGFLCKCIRCLDPTEMGTMMSAITCSDCLKKNESGYYLPQDPLDLEASAVWKCTLCQGDLNRNNLEQVKEIADLIDYMESNPLPELNASFETFCLKLINKYSQSFLHPNHWVLQRAARAFVKKMTPKMMRLDKKGYENYLELSLYLLKIAGKICPGISFDRGSLLLHTSRAFAELVTKHGKDLSRAKKAEYLTLCQQMQAEAYEYHKSDLPLHRETLSYDAQCLKSEIQSVKLWAMLELGDE